ncbi:MAG: AsmA-like C-terminal region-containing protein [Luteolibacter sp.]|uniref:AsmA-like C-terminal region-containing protein n=1 Tax=Luteolibacter sp. TaxID=1962973 RepID=UPI003262F4EA
MYRLHLARNLRSLAFLLVFAAILAAIGGLWWANHTGMPESWRVAIEKAVSKQGAHIKIGSLRYVPLKGVIASDLRVYSEPEHLREISRLERVILDFDKTRLARGIIHLNKIQLKDAQLVLPVDPDDPKSDTLNVTDAYGTIFMPGDRRLEIRGARGKIAGIDVSLNARLIGYQQAGKTPPDDKNAGKRRELLARVISELGKWHFNEDHPPALQIVVEGDVNDRSSITAKVGLQIKGMEKNGHMLDQVTAQADLAGDLLTITSLKATDSRGVLDGHVDYDIHSREGRFDISSSLEIPQLLTTWLGLPSLQQVLIGGKQIVEAEGDFKLDENNKPEIRTTGHVRCESVMLRGVLFDSVESSFSWRDNILFLRDVELARGDGAAHAKALIEWPVVRLDLKTTLPIPVYRPFFVGQPLEMVLNDFSEREGATVDVKLEGSFDASNKTAWAYTGGGTVKNVNYKGVPVNSANCKFTLNHYELDFHDGTVVFNYSKYPLRKAFGGPAEATAKVGRIRYDAPNKLVEVENVVGAIWAAPMVRFFATPVADSLEQYRFHQPPELKASGVVDVTPQGRTDLHIAFSSSHPADYLFLGENVTLGQPSGKVDIRGERTIVSDLKVDAFEGPVAGRIEYLGKGRLEGDLSWTKLSIPLVTSTYGFQMKGGGTTTGRIDFSLADGKVETMGGEGLLAVEKTELFSVPMFGPLTPLIGGVLNDETAGTQMAKNAFCTFKIENGILSSNDFQTSTKSLNFAGDGSVNMNDRTIDMTIRMNARGFLLGLITMPLRPFSGLFQFHGSGALKDPKWESMKFTSPPESQNQILQTPPRARVISGGE